jgi:hypothetical protein
VDFCEPHVDFCDIPLEGELDFGGLGGCQAA